MKTAMIKTLGLNGQLEHYRAFTAMNFRGTAY